jgi:GNAT superfamily N-acetyltransferase
MGGLQVRREPDSSKWSGGVTFQPSTSPSHFDWEGVHGSSEYVCYSVTLNGSDVARFSLRYGGQEFHEGLRIPSPDLPYVEIHLIEVLKPYRGKGLATEIVGLIGVMHPQERIVALSFRADEFWSGLGWAGYRNRDGTGFRYFLNE